MTVEEYIQYRTGANKISSIVGNMFMKPFLASSLRSFWKYWNPGFGYYLLYFIYKPMRSLFPHWISLIVTFLICGLLHDLIYVIPMLMINGGGFTFPLITVWFLVISIGVLITELFQIDFRKTNKNIRPIFHFSYLVGTFCFTRYIDLMIG
ncbi:MBOAT family O-acyltransferase [Croceitalea sp. P059]|uniref:MBOAT family O-acyltransferase n=1 Tax=Croceitalea sp. P059 TaxID=3075601 RepID=UPI002885A76C|nr:MBOAT family O-acyltransferase [Croceitalea sp. P059]MDT0540688.1 MBOAT family protein [Croceitalea sp. P059]